MPSLFEEEILHEEIELNRAFEAGSEHFAEALDYFPNVEGFATRERSLPRLDRGTEGAVVGARHREPQRHEQRRLGSARGADRAGRRRRARAEPVSRVRRIPSAKPSTGSRPISTSSAPCGDALGIPLAVKLSPYYSAMANFARGVVDAGADGLVLFNRFYQPDLDLDTLDVVNRVELSHPGELRLPLRWIAILRPQLGDDVSIAATSGVHAGTDVVKAIMVGADVAMLTSAVLRHGPDHLRVVEAELTAWMAEHDYESVTQMRGSATQTTSGDPAAFERANYVQMLHSWSTPSPSAAPSV